VLHEKFLSICRVGIPRITGFNAVLTIQKYLTQIWR